MDTETNTQDHPQGQIVRPETFFKVRAMNALKNYGEGKTVRFTTSSGIQLKCDDVDVLSDEVKRNSKIGKAFVEAYKNISLKEDGVKSMFSGDFRREGSGKAWINDQITAFISTIRSVIDFVKK